MSQKVFPPSSICMTSFEDDPLNVNQFKTQQQELALLCHSTELWKIYHPTSVVYFNHYFGAVHSKCWLKYAFSHFLHAKRKRKNKKGKWSKKHVFWPCTHTLVEGFIWRLFIWGLFRTRLKQLNFSLELKIFELKFLVFMNFCIKYIQTISSKF